MTTLGTSESHNIRIQTYSIFRNKWKVCHRISSPLGMKSFITSRQFGEKLLRIKLTRSRQRELPDLTSAQVEQKLFPTSTQVVPKWICMTKMECAFRNFIPDELAGFHFPTTCREVRLSLWTNLIRSNGAVFAKRTSSQIEMKFLIIFQASVISVQMKK